MLPVKACALNQFSDLTLSAQEVAVDLGIDDEIKELFALRAKRSAAFGDTAGGAGGDNTQASALKVDDPDTIRILLLRQEITETILASVLDLRVVIARIDQQGTSYDALKAYLEEKRDKAIRNNNISNFLANGALTMASNGWEIPPGETPETVGAMIGAVSGVVTTGISTWALKLSGGEKRSSSASPNMLARFFNLSDASDEDYPKEIWRYIADQSPVTPGTSRKEQLIKRWLELKRVEQINTPQGKQRLALLCGTVAQVKTVSIDLLDDRVSMLADVKAMVGQLFKELMELMRAIHGRKSTV